MSLSIFDIISNYKKNIDFNKEIIYNVSIFCKHNEFIYMDNFLLNIDYNVLPNVFNYSYNKKLLYLDKLLADKISNLLKKNYVSLIINNNFVNSNNPFISNNNCIVRNKKIINNKVKYLVEVSYNNFIEFIKINNHNASKHSYKSLNTVILNKYKINKKNLY